MRTAQRFVIWFAIVVTILAGIENGVAINIQAHVRLNLVVISRAVAVAIRFTFIGHAVAVQILAPAEEDIPIIRHAVLVAVRLTFIRDAVAVEIVAETGLDVSIIQFAVAVAVLTFVRYAVAVDVGAIPLVDVDGVVHAVAVAILYDTIHFEDVALNERLYPSMKAEIDIRIAPRQDMAITHDRAALKLANVAVVDAVAVSVQGAAVMSQLVRRDDDVPISRVGHL